MTYATLVYTEHDPQLEISVFLYTPPRIMRCNNGLDNSQMARRPPAEGVRDEFLTLQTSSPELALRERQDFDLCLDMDDRWGVRGREPSSYIVDENKHTDLGIPQTPGFLLFSPPTPFSNSDSQHAFWFGLLPPCLVVFRLAGDGCSSLPGFATRRVFPSFPPLFPFVYLLSFMFTTRSHVDRVIYLHRGQRAIYPLNKY